MNADTQRWVVRTRIWGDVVEAVEAFGCGDAEYAHALIDQAADLAMLYDLASDDVGAEMRRLGMGRN